MKILINNYINLIKAFTSDGVKKLDSFDDLKQFCDEELDIFILDPKIHNNKINLPLASRSILKKSIPHVLQDKSLNFKENSHFSFNNPSIDGDTFISFVDRDWIVSTSEDINNLSYALMLKEVRENILATSFNNLILQINSRAEKYSDIAMLSRTHGQSATPTTIGKEFSIYSYRLHKQLDKFNNIQIYGKMNGAVGNYNAHNIAYPSINWPEVTKKFIENFGILQATHTTQIEAHDWMAEYMQSIIRFNNVSIDLCQDMWSYISLGYFKSMVNKKEVGSSTMPHKVNPIDFENAEGNFGLSNSNLVFLSNKLPQSRWQRDLTDSTCLRNLAVGISHSLIAVQSCLVGINKLEPNTELIASDLENNYELLAEAIQTVMRKHNILGAYEQLKELTRGKKVTQTEIRNFINSIDGLPSNDKQILSSLSPKDYIGLAAKLACSVKLEK